MTMLSQTVTSLTTNPRRLPRSKQVAARREYDRGIAPGRSTARGAFTITELLVVIGIIVLLASLLLVALGQVRTGAMKTRTSSTMQNFAQSADAFQTEHGRYPGVIPERVLAYAIAEGTIDGADGRATLSSTENALLHLMGGYRVIAPQSSEADIADYEDFNEDCVEDPDENQCIEMEIEGPNGRIWELLIDPNRIGDGPFINGQAYAPYFTPSTGQVRRLDGQVVPEAGIESPLAVPDLLDAWEMPILYTRQIHSRSERRLVWAGNENHEDDAGGPQFVMDGMRPYLDSETLGDEGVNQMYGAGNSAGSILSWGTATGSSDLPYANFAQIIRHPAFGTWGDDSPLDEVNVGQVRPRGAYVLISAGPDSVYFSAADGPGTRQNPVTNLTDDPDIAHPSVVEEYDDVTLFGGG